jgi:hypothetical protein
MFREFVDNCKRVEMITIACLISSRFRSIRSPGRHEKRTKMGMAGWCAHYWDQVKDILPYIVVREVQLNWDDLSEIMHHPRAPPSNGDWTREFAFRQAF